VTERSPGNEARDRENEAREGAEPPATVAEGSEVSKDNGDDASPIEVEELFGRPLFPETFATFLRFNPALWRMRRVDRFVPQDLDLAEHQTSIQGLIDVSLLEEFLARRTDVLRLPDVEARNGDPITLFVPAISAPKRLLLNFSARGEGGESLPMLSRAEGSTIVARDLLSRLLRNSVGRVDGLEDLTRAHERLSALITTLVFLNPHRLAERLERWPHRRHRLRGDRGLDRRDLVEWVRQEGEEFIADGGQLLAGELASFLQKERLAGGPLPERMRPDGLRYFPTLESLLLHGVQDLLKIVVQSEEAWGAGSDELNRRAALMRDMSGIAIRVSDALNGLPLLYELLSRQRDHSATVELYRHLDRWTAFAVVDARLGVPFVLKFSQTLPLTERRKRRWFLKPFVYVRDKFRLFRTFHLYPLAGQDAISVHAEVAVPDPELRLPRRSAVVRARGRRRRRVHHIFGHELRPTGRLLHRYSSRRPEATKPPTLTPAAAGELFLRVQLKLLRSIRYGYTFAPVAFLMAGAYVSWVVGDALIDHRTVAKPETQLAVGALAATLSLWLTAVQHRRAVVYRKLWLARRLFYLALYLTLIPLALYGLREFAPERFYDATHWLRELVPPAIRDFAGDAAMWVNEKRLDS
jgi:hypothetical protein